MANNISNSVAILGSGESAMGAVRLATKQGMNCFLSDSAPIADIIKRELNTLDCPFEENGHTINNISKYDEVVKSPGIPSTAKIVKDIRSLNIPVISEIEFASRFTDAKIIAITGSNGKTTTTLLVTHLLKSAGLNADYAGNIGNSFSNLLVHDNPEIIVLELSSFQLDDIIDFKPNIALLLNISADHLDRYQYDINLYADAKMNLIKNMSSNDLLIYNVDDEILSQKVRDSKSDVFNIQVSVNEKLTEGVFQDEDNLIFAQKENIHTYVINALPLLGKHNMYNQMMAISAAVKMEASQEGIKKGLDSFVNVAHRLESIATIDGVEFINDSKATNVDAVFYALDAMPNDVIWIAGGINKGNDYNQIHDLVKQKVSSMICLGLDNLHLTSYFGDDVDNVVEVSDMNTAVELAFRMSKSGDKVLLSPACSSFDLFENYEDRGNQFKSSTQSILSSLNQIES